jgi:hypothetical protein
MKSIYIGDELHRRAKLKATEAGMPLKEYIEILIERNLRDAQQVNALAPLPLRETLATYEVAVTTDTAQSNTDQWLDQLERKGLLVRGERLHDQLAAEYLALRKTLGLTGPPLPTPDIAEVRAIFQRQRELHPEVPSVTEILLQMREEE